MQIIINPGKSQWPEVVKRPVFDTSKLENLCSEVFFQVKVFKDEALKRYTSQFDKVNISDFRLTEEELASAYHRIPYELKQAIELAKQNITRFHQSQQINKNVITTTPGVECWQESRAIDKIGIYIPGGSAPLFSTVLMLAIPAKIAGCSEIILCSPPNQAGKIADEILYAAVICGVNKVFKVGGIQAIAAMCLGTETIPSVYKIFGPGNQFVTAAKQHAQQLGTAIDMPAGPSEVLVMADESAIPEFVAADLLSQAEHGADSQVILLTTDQNIAKSVNELLYKQLDNLPRKDIASKAISQSKIICLTDRAACVELINLYAPEHLILAVNEYEYFIKGLINAGSVFIGNYSSESAGDYASGTNHTLPTNGFARAYSGANLDSFLKKITFQKISAEGLQNIGPAIEIMAEAEGLQAHKNAITIRLNSLKS
jgi:histidinol dehydrogenase